MRDGLRSRRYGFFKAVFLGAILLNIMLLPINVSFSATAAAASAGASVWWPTNGAHLSGVQPFKARVDGLDAHSYEMFWQVDDGTWNWMDTSTTDGPHKEASVDVSGWTWKGSGPYKLTFIARQNDAIIARTSISVYTGSAEAVAAPMAQTASALVVSAPVTASAFYVNPNSSAKAQANEWRASRPNDAAKMDYLAAQATAVWLGAWNTDVQADVSKVVTAASKAGQMPVFVAYNIPNRDCGGYSAGGASDKDAYTAWIGSVARGIGSKPATVILEPDALAGISCLSQAGQQARTDMLASATSILKSNGATRVYIDAGHSGWVDAATMAARLEVAGIHKADGFALNVSNFDTTSSETGYGSAVSQVLGGAHFVIDTSRNGNGSNAQWCNPQGRAVGVAPTSNTGNPRIDAYLWLKTPGESDGTCNGGPSAGTWWPDYALSLGR